MTAAYQVAIASVAGVAITLQGQFMGLMDRTLGTKESVFVTYATGGVIAAFFMLAARGGNLRAWSAVPWYAFTAGILGLIIVGSVGYVVPRLGVAKAFTLIVATEFLIAALIDHFGFFAAEIRPIDSGRLTGLFLMLIGVWLVIR